MEPFIGQWPTFGNSGIPKGLLSEEIPTRPGFKEGVISRRGFPAARPIFPAAGFRGLSILTLVTLVIAWAPRCEAGSEIRPVSGMGYTVFATGLAGPRGLLFSPSGDLFAVEQHGGTIVRITPYGRVSHFAKGFSAPHDLAFDASGYLYVADTGANRVARVSPNGSVTIYIPGLNVPVDLAFHPNGELFVCELYAGTVTAYKKDSCSRLRPSRTPSASRSGNPGIYTLPSHRQERYQGSRWTARASP
jgi:hypothetical protein